MTNVAPGIKYPPKPPKPMPGATKKGTAIPKIGGKRGGPVTTRTTKRRRPNMGIA